jgi:AcrR family transcriptional regulator
MAAKKKVAQVPAGRQAAYTARNRAKLLHSAQQVLADIGPTATIEQIAEIAEVSPTTIYKYFDNKEILFREALGLIWREWVEWSYNGAPPAQSIEAVLDSARKLFWVKQTHPLMAKILHNTLENPMFIIQAVSGGATEVFRGLAERGDLSNQNFENRILLWAYCLAGLMTAVHVTGELSPTDAEVAFGIGLSIWGVSDAKAKKLMARPLVFAPVK